MKPLLVLLVMMCVISASAVAQDLSRAVRFFESQQWASCVAELEPVSTSHPDKGDVQRLLGHAYAELGRDGEARRALGLAIAYGRATDAVPIRLARLTQKDDPITALEALRRAWMQAPQIDVGLTLLDLALELGRTEEAEAMTRVLWERGERPVEVLRRAAVLHERAGRFAEAATALETALLLTTPNAEAMESVAALHERRGDPERAAQLIHRVLSWRVDGVLAWTPISRDGAAMLKRSGVTVIQICDPPARPIDIGVGFDQAELGLELARFAHQRGYRAPQTPIVLL